MRPRHAGVIVAALGGLLTGSGWAQTTPTPDAPSAENSPPAVRSPSGASPGFEVGAQLELTLMDGRRVVGELLEVGDTRFVIRIGEVATPFEKSDIRGEPRKLPSVDESYQSLRAAIADEDVEGRLQLAEWCRARGRIDLALWETDQALEAEPGNPKAREMHTLLVEQEKLNRSSGRGETDDAFSAQARKARLADGTREKFPLLSPEQINLIRVYEVDLRNPPRMVIPRSAVETFLDTYKGKMISGKGAVPVTPEARDIFLHQSAPDTLGWFFDARARELYPKVQVMENPESFKLFRDSVNRTWLTNACATNRCHGGEDAGRLWLYNLRSATDAAAYTNFLILDRYRTDTGARLIDYDKPEDSLILQMALPKEQAVTRHPEITGPARGRWRPAFTDARDPRYRRVLEWIRSMYPQRPEYPIEYVPPVPHSAPSLTPGPR